MKEIVVISGKGGTGKTSVTCALAFIDPDSLVLADCDVDAADVHLIMKPTAITSEDFHSGIKAVIDSNKCISCGACARVCRFEAISHAGSSYTVNPLDCEGCGYCYQVCPAKAIELPIQKVGNCYTSLTRIGSHMVHAKLGIGADNSGKLVAKVKKEAKVVAEQTNKSFILVDGSPGIGCPVISSLSGADYALLVTEPTISGLSDLQRVFQLSAKFRIPTGCIINKADLNPDVARQIINFLNTSGIKHIANIPYDEDFSKAITLGKSLVEYNPNKWLPLFQNIWQQLSKETL
jgi:MinD superfamily P-loop ATPase